MSCALLRESWNGSHTHCSPPTYTLCDRGARTTHPCFSRGRLRIGNLLPLARILFRDIALCISHCPFRSEGLCARLAPCNIHFSRPLFFHVFFIHERTTTHSVPRAPTNTNGVRVEAVGRGLSASRGVGAHFHCTGETYVKQRAEMYFCSLSPPQQQDGPASVIERTTRDREEEKAEKLSKNSYNF